MRFVETPVFTKRVKELLPDDDYRALQIALLLRPEPGARFPHQGRWRPPKSALPLRANIHEILATVGQPSREGRRATNLDARGALEHEDGPADPSPSPEAAQFDPPPLARSRHRVLRLAVRAVLYRTDHPEINHGATETTESYAAGWGRLKDPVC